jgi:hypothetical protein
MKSCLDKALAGKDKRPAIPATGDRFLLARSRFADMSNMGAIRLTKIRLMRIPNP